MFYKYAYTDCFDSLVSQDFSKFNSNIIIYGAAVVGAVTEHALKQKGIAIAGFCDSSINSQGNIFQGYTVLSPQQAREKHPNAIYLVATAKLDIVSETLHGFGVLDSDIYDVIPLVYSVDLEGFDFPMSEKQIFRLIDAYLFTMSERHILRILPTYRCTLRCKDCQNLVPYFDKPKDFEWAHMKNALEKYFNAFNVVHLVGITGGEPFIYPHISELIDFLENIPGCKKIHPTTNGTVVPSPELLESLKNSKKVHVRISDYGTHSRKIHDLESVFAANNISYERSMQFDWYQFKINEAENSNINDLKKMYHACNNTNFPTLAGNILYRCAFSTSLNCLGFEEKQENSSFDLSSDDFNPQKLRSWVEQTDKIAYLESCKYCPSRSCSSEKVPVGVQAPETLHFKKKN